MKITYNKNPLFTTIELDENEKKELWYKIKIAQMTDLLEEAEFSLTDDDYFNLTDAKKYVDSNYYNPANGEKSQLDKHCDMVFGYYIHELKSCHYGDCVCFSSSCVKCNAESLLGIDTTKGLKPHAANKIFSAFGGIANDKTIDEAINKLANFNINPDDYTSENWEKIGGYEQHITRWKQENKEAHDWLVSYKKRIFLK